MLPEKKSRGELFARFQKEPRHEGPLDARKPGDYESGKEVVKKVAECAKNFHFKKSGAIESNKNKGYPVPQAVTALKEIS